MAQDEEEEKRVTRSKKTIRKVIEIERNFEKGQEGRREERE